MRTKRIHWFTIVIFMFIANQSYAQKEEVRLNAAEEFGYSAGLNATGMKNPGNSTIRQHTSNLVYCKVNGIANRMNYDRKGNLNFTIRYYTEDLLAEDIRRIVKSSFYDYNITCVTELNAENRIVYLLNIKNGNAWKRIMIRDGEMSVEQAFTE